MTLIVHLDEKKTVEELMKTGVIIKAADIIKKGGTVAFPTETVYGLGANAFLDSAVKKIYEAKGRPSDNPMIVHVSNNEMLKKCVKNTSEVAKLLIDKFFPAPLTLVMDKSDAIPSAATGGLETVGIRMPRNNIALALIEAAGVPIAAPSANISGRPSPTSYVHVIQDLDRRVDMIICGSDSDIGIESTVLDISEYEAKILRPGAISAEMLSKYIKVYKHMGAEVDRPKSPGMKYKHYSPKADVYILKKDKKYEEVAKIVEGFESKGSKVLVINQSNSKVLAKEIFSKLRFADSQGFDVVLVVEVSGDEMSDAVMNRIMKSADGKMI